MTPMTLQPTFTVDLPVSAADAVSKLQAAIRQSRLRDHVVTAGTCFDFRVESSSQRFWSPHLSVQVSDKRVDDHGPRLVDAETDNHVGRHQHSQLFGRFSPRPEIWTMFMAVYGVVLILMFASAILGYVQWALGDSPWALAVLPTGAVLIMGLHAGSLVGQRLSADQMHLLRGRLDEAIDIAFPNLSESP